MVVEPADAPVGPEVVVEGAVLLHDHHDVLDRAEIRACGADGHRPFDQRGRGVGPTGRGQDARGACRRTEEASP